jgi:hypothetical protein
VFADTSGVRRFDYLVRAIQRAGPHKLLFGSDGPWLHPGVEIQKIRLLGLSSVAEALVLGDNARRLLFRGSAPPQTKDNGGSNIALRSREKQRVEGRAMRLG